MLSPRRQILDILGPLLPADLRPFLEDPSRLSDPREWPAVVRLVWPAARLLVVILAFYIVWSTISAVLGYFSRFMRFAIKVGPIIGFIGWLMANSGQGDLGDVFELAKQWVGLGDPNAQARGTGLGSSWGAGQGRTGASTRRRSSTKRSAGDTTGGQSATDFVASMLRSAVGGEGVDTQNVVQSFVKQALAKAAGLEDWLGGGADAKEKEKKKRTR